MNMANSNPFYQDYVPPRSSETSFPWAFVLLVALVIVGAVAGWLWFHHPQSGLNPDAQSLPVAARGPLLKEEQANIQLYEKVSSSVVHVTNLAQSGSRFSLNVQEVPKGTGSGFVWDDQGHIVTNYHVVQGADTVQVTLADQSTYSSTDVWAYPDKDIAVIWIQAPKSKLHPIRMGTSNDLKVGQITYAIGNPFGLDQTMTMGIVSALSREIQSATGRPIRGVIQTSAAINPGNSGGPLFDSDGRLIGMTTAILSPSGAFAGIGFAIPADEINRVVPQLIRHGKVVRPRLGVEIAEDQLAQRLGVDEGALLIKVVPGGPAATAGLKGTRRDTSGQIQLGDIIVGVGDKTIEIGKDLFAAVEDFKVGDKVTITFLRAGQRKQVDVVLQAAE
jgi:S1-C subfamily serine protease